MNQLIGQTLDRYQITALLGQGGMGAVYRARDLTLRREVALKLMHGHLAVQAEFKARFVQEAQAAANLDHPGIVKVFDFKESNEQLYIVMEYLAGGNLKEMMRRMRESQRWLLLPDIVDLVQQLALALDYAHRQGVLHRDIKPGNIMLKPDLSDSERYIPVITDMGLAKLAESSIHTQAGESLGTPAYMSPEQAMGQPVGPPTDIFALGVVLYELAVGQLPFTAKTISEAMQIHGKGTSPPPPRTRRPDLPQALESVILNALANQPAKRFKSAKELATALASASSQTVIHSVPPTANKGALSLATLYQDSVIAGTSQLPTRRSDETEPPASGSKPMLRIKEPGGGTRLVELGSGPITVGRDQDNKIALDDQRVSRHHARIEKDGTQYRVLDLSSRNGTFLDNTRLLAGVPERWQPNQMLKIGDHWLELIGVPLQNQPAAAKVPVSNTVGVSGTVLPDVELRLASNQLQVEPGKTTELSCRLRNLTSTANQFQIGLTGIPAEWISLPRMLHLSPGGEEEIKLPISPPRSSQTSVGQRTLRLYVQHKESETALAAEQIMLTVAPYHQLALTLNPQRRRSNPPGEFQLRLHNQGNEELRVKFSGEDANREATFTFEPPEVSVPAGSRATAALHLLVASRAVHKAETVCRFSVWAQGIKIPEVSAQVSGEWECLMETKSFEAELLPAQLSSPEFGEFKLQLKNTGKSSTTVRLTAVDNEQLCTYTFDPAQVVLNSGASQSVLLTVKPRQTQARNHAYNHQFTVTATTMETPVVVKQFTGEWIQPADVAESKPKPEPDQPKQPKRRWWRRLLSIIIKIVIWLVIIAVILIVGAIIVSNW